MTEPPPPPPPSADCAPRECGEAFLCGSIEDGCGRVVDCGRCPDDHACTILADRSYCEPNSDGRPDPKRR